VLEHVEHQLSGLTGEHQTITKSGSAVDLVGEVDSLQRGGQVGNNTGHTQVESLLGDAVQAESLLDNFLYTQLNLAIIQYTIGHPWRNTYRLGPHASHHIDIVIILTQ
jgi:hypothetical protein